jgi:acetyl esterase/lipase
MVAARSNMLPRVSMLILCVFLLLGCSTNRALAQTTTTPITETDIVYSRIGDIELRLDIASPSEGNGPFPAVLFFCGNGWGYYSSINRTQYDCAIREAAQRGYVAVTADYRSTNLKKDGKAVYRFPDQVIDVKCAIRWLRANADKYRIDRDRVGVIGWSSGGYLALMLGLTDPSDGLEGDCGDLSISTRVQAVVSLAGPTELVSEVRESKIPAYTIDFMGGTPEELTEQYHKASPLTYVSRDDPPVLTLQGSKDISVPPNQAALLNAKMREVGASHTLIIKDGFGHSNFYYDPSVWEFMDKYLVPRD